MPKAPPLSFETIADNAVLLLNRVRQGLIDGGWSPDKAEDMTKQWYTDWSAYTQSIGSAGLGAAAGIAEAWIALHRK